MDTLRQVVSRWQQVPNWRGEQKNRACSPDRRFLLWNAVCPTRQRQALTGDGESSEMHDMSGIAGDSSLPILH